MNKEEIIKKVLDNSRRTVPNPSFEACNDPDSGLPNGRCEACRKYYKTAYEACQRGEMIVETKDTGELLKEALDLLEPEGTRYVILNWNNLSDLSILVDPDTPEPMRFHGREEAEAVAMAYCAWNWKVVGI